MRPFLFAKQLSLYEQHAVQILEHLNHNQDRPIPDLRLIIKCYGAASPDRMFAAPQNICSGQKHNL